MNLHTIADLQATPPRRLWQSLRTLRAHPPGRAAQGHRKRTFSAALEQAEQLLTAARDVGVATQPILIFYAVSQIGRAVAAASTRLSDAEYRLIGHGLDDQNIGMKDLHLASVGIRGAGKGSFPVVARALGSCAVSMRTDVGVLWGLIPDGDRFAFPGIGSRRPLVLTSYESDRLASGLDFVQCRVQILDTLPGGPAPAEIANLLAAPSMTPGTIEAQAATIRTLLRDFPTLAAASLGYSSPLQPVPVGFTDDGILDVPIRVPKEVGTSVARALQPCAPAYHGVHRVYPDLDGCGRPVAPLMLWWAVLYVLSRLARYLPNEWEQLIDVGRSPMAVAIEYLLDEALIAIPDLAMSALEMASQEHAQEW